MMVKFFAIFTVSVLYGLFAKAHNRVFFDPGHYTAVENVRTISLTVTRQSEDLTKTLCVDYKSTDESATAGSDYEYTEGTLVFYPGVIHRQLSLTVIDDNVFEEDEHLYVQLSDIREVGGNNCDGNSIPVARQGMSYLASIMILDDDCPGKFDFEEVTIKVADTVGMVSIKVVRSLGARGKVNVPYHSVDGTARSGVDFIPVDSNLTFENDENEQYVNVGIIDTDNTEIREFTVMLAEPRLIEEGPGPGAQPELGDVAKIKIQII